MVLMNYQYLEKLFHIIIGQLNNEFQVSIHINLNLTDKQKKEVQEVVRIRVDELNALISKIMVHLDYDKELHNTVRNNLFTVQISAFDLHAEFKIKIK